MTYPRLACEDCGSDVEKGAHWHPVVKVGGPAHVLCGPCKESQGRWLIRALRVWWEQDWKLCDATGDN